MGGTGPITGSQVTLYEAGHNGYRTGAQALGSATADSNGSFTINFTPPATDTLLYLVALGGDGGAGNNSAIGMMGIVGLSKEPSNPVTINELTTVAGEWALSQFADSTGQQVGTSLTNVIGILNAASQAFDNLVNTSTGDPASHLPSALECSSGLPPINCDALNRLDTLGNIIAACVQSSGPSPTLPLCAAATSGCDILLACTGTPANGTTLQAAHAIATNPVSNLSQLFAAQSLAQPYQPTLTVAPDGFEIALNNAAPVAGFNGPIGIAVDLPGNVWIANSSGNSVTELDARGRFVGNFTPQGARFNAPYAVAISAKGFIWITNSNGANVTELDLAGDLVASHSPAGALINEPYGIEMDAADNVWVANFASNSVSELMAIDGYDSGFNFAATVAGFNGPVEMAIDTSGNVWAGNFIGNSISELTASSAYTTGFNFAPGGAALNSPLGLGLDAANNIWAGNFNDLNISELTASSGYTTGLSFSPAGVDLFTPAILKLDSAGNIWTVNFASGTLSELFAGCASGSCAGLNLDPFGADMNTPYGIAVDAAGNVWVTNSGGNSVSEFIGLAAPTGVPALCLKQNQSASCLP